MAYEKQIFINGQVLTAEQLNYMEDGIIENSTAGDTVKSQIAQIEDHFEIIHHESENRLNPDDDDFLEGYRLNTTTGVPDTAIYSAETYCVTGFIPVTDGKTYGVYAQIASGRITTLRCRDICFYDGNKKFLSYYGELPYDIEGKGGITVTSESGKVCYMRFSYVITDLPIQVSETDGIPPIEIVGYVNQTTVRLKNSDYDTTKSVEEKIALSQKQWLGKKWVCVGDSLTESNDRTSKNYHDYVAEKTGITVVNMGKSGSGYMRRNDEGFAFYQRILNVPTDADVVTIFGSGNDTRFISNLGSLTDTGTETLYGCINTTIDNLYSILPSVQLGIVAPTPWENNTPADNGTMAQYCQALETVCKNRGIPYLDLFHSSGLRPNDEGFRGLAYSKDEGNGVHPDETGHKMIASQFYALLQSLIGLY